MAIISYSKDTLIDYIPEYAGNRDSESPCIVRLKFVPYAKVIEYSRLIASRAKGAVDAKNISIAQEVQKKQFMDSVESVSGYYVDGKEEISASIFYETAPAELIHEIIRAMESAQKLNEGQRKN